MSRFNASIRNDLQRSLSKARKELDKVVIETTGANSEPVKQAAFALAKAWRRVLSVPGDPSVRSSPGEPPRAQTKKLRKSIRTAVVDGTRRVGTNSYVARLLEFGYQGRKPRTNKGKRAQGPRGIPVAPRPHAQVALEQVKDQMTDVLVSAVQRRVAKGAT